MNVKSRCFVTACLVTSLATVAVAASKQPLKKLKHDANVPAVDLFDAIEQGLVETNVIAKNSHEAHVFVTNKSDAPVSIKVPQAVVATQVLKQFFPGGAGATGNGRQQGGNMAGGAAQPIGGGVQGGQNQGMNNGPTMMGQGNPFGNNIGNGFQNVGNGFFSVPAQKTVQVPLTTVCLAHGKPDPRQRMKYQLVKLEDYSSDPVLHETLKLFAAGATDTETAQAAVWHLTDKMSWSDLKAKQIERIGLDPVPYFNEKQVDAAAKLVEQARGLARDFSRKAETAAK